MKRKHDINRIITILLILICSGVSAQTKLDSFWRIWDNKRTHDTTKLKYIHEIVDGYIESNPDSAFYFAQMMYDYATLKNQKKPIAMALKAKGQLHNFKGEYLKALIFFENSLVIYKELSNEKGIADLFGLIGVTYYRLSQFPKAIEYCQKALKLNEKLGNKKGIAFNLNRIGDVYWQLSLLNKALEYWQKALKLNEQLNDKDGIADDLNGIGIIYRRSKNYPKALEYYQKSLKIYEELGNKQGIANLTMNIGIVYSNQGDYSRALTYFLKAKNIRLELGSSKYLGAEDNEIGHLYFLQGNFDEALKYYFSSLTISKNNGEKLREAETEVNIGEVLLKQANPSKAFEWCERALKVAEELGTISQQKDACNCLYNASKALGNCAEAITYLKKMQVLVDSLHIYETTEKLQQMEFAQQIQADSLKQLALNMAIRHSHEAEVRKKNRTRNILIASGILFLALSGGLFSRLRYVRKSRTEILKERDRSENLLLNILPEEIAQELKLNGKAEARDFDLVSILFTDFKGFTEASAKMSAALLVGEINACFEAFDGIMEKYQIEKIKTIGDSYMAAGGLPVPTDNSVKNTILAALEMQTFITKRKTDNEAQNKPAFEMRVGIHTGPVVAGIVGVKKFQYDIWGDTVNTASRMESNGEVGKVNISQSTYEIIKNDADFVCVSRGKIEAKGKGEIEMYFVEGRI